MTKLRLTDSQKFDFSIDDLVFVDAVYLSSMETDPKLPALQKIGELGPFPIYLLGGDLQDLSDMVSLGTRMAYLDGEYNIATVKQGEIDKRLDIRTIPKDLLRSLEHHIGVGYFSDEPASDGAHLYVESNPNKLFIFNQELDLLGVDTVSGIKFKSHKGSMSYFPEFHSDEGQLTIRSGLDVRELSLLEVYAVQPKTLDLGDEGRSGQSQFIIGDQCYVLFLPSSTQPLSKEKRLLPRSSTEFFPMDNMKKLKHISLIRNNW